jgi:hypothetical protein
MTEPEAPADVYAADGYFIVIPEWILDSGISSRAVHLYALLRRYADLRTRMAHPSRRTLAEGLKVSDEKTVDRAIEELAAAGTIRVRARYGNGQRARIQDGPSPEFPQRVANAYFLLARPHPRSHYADVDAHVRAAEAGIDAHVRINGSDLDVTQSENGGGGGMGAPTPSTSRGSDQRRRQAPGGTTTPTPGAESGEGWGHQWEDLGAPVGEVLKPKALTKNTSSPAVREGAGDYAESFAVFWQTYPRKVGKLAAEKAFQKAAKAAGGAQVVLNGLVGATFPADRQYIPHPATWLNQGRWADEPEPAARPAKETRPWEHAQPAATPAAALAKETRPWEQ